MIFRKLRNKIKGGVTLQGANMSYQNQQQAMNERAFQEQRQAQERLVQEQRASAQRQVEQRQQAERRDAETRQIERVVQERVKTEFSNRNHGRGPDALSYDQGNMFPIPEGAVGPIPTKHGDGVQYTVGKGGNGLHENVYGVRFHSEGRHHPERVVYFNEQKQTVDPITGQTIAHANPMAHLKPKKKNF